MKNKDIDSFYPTILSGMSDLKSRLWYVLLMLIIYRIASYIPLPCVDAITLANYYSEQYSSVMGMFDMFTGGAFSRMSILSLNIMPYISASIIIQCFALLYKDSEFFQNDISSGKNKMLSYTKYLTVFLATIQGYALSVNIESMQVNGVFVVTDQSMFYRLLATVTLVAGTMFVVWLADQITLQGVGNGSSLIIFVGIAASLPSSLIRFFELSRVGSISYLSMLLIMSILFLLVYCIVMCERAQRRINVHYSRKQVGNKLYDRSSSYIPLKVNTAGVIPPIFANSVMLIPSTISTWAGSDSSWYSFLAHYLHHGSLWYVGIYITLIIIFNFFYTSLIFNPNEVSDNLRKTGGVVMSRRPGAPTAMYLESVLMKLTLIGSLYISVICAFPELLMSYYSVPFYLGGTSLLIIVNVIMDSVSQIQVAMLGSRYDKIMKKMK